MFINCHPKHEKMKKNENRMCGQCYDFICLKPSFFVLQNSCEKMKQDGAHEPECKHIRQTTVYKKRHSRLDYLFHSPARCWTSCAGDSTTKAACAGDFTTKLRLHHEGSLFCIQIKHWRKGSGRSAARKKQWHCQRKGSAQAWWRFQDG